MREDVFVARVCAQRTRVAITAVPVSRPAPFGHPCDARSVGSKRLIAVELRQGSDVRELPAGLPPAGTDYWSQWDRRIRFGESIGQGFIRVNMRSPLFYADARVLRAARIAFNDTLN